MSFVTGAAATDGRRTTRTGGTSLDTGGASPASEPPRDIKKLVLIIGLGALSWVATYVGMLELIEANMGELPLVHRLIIGFSVAMLMVMIIWLLDQMFAPVPFLTKVAYAVGYVFLTLISVGFGFGFYWKVLESRAESSRSAEAAVSQVQTALYGAAARLDQLQGTLVNLAGVSAEKAEIERTKGTSCPNSRPGDGPRRKLRDDDAARFQFASDFVKGRAGAVKGELQALDADLLKIANRDPATVDAATGTRTEFMKGLSRKLDMTVTGFNAFRTDPQLRQLRTELSDRAERSTFGDPKAGGFICPDAQLQGALRGAVRAIDELPVLEKPTIANVEGSEATVEAFRRLTATFYGLLSFKLPPTIDEIRALQQKAVQSLEGPPDAKKLDETSAGLSSRDYVPLAIAVFVDLCLLLVSMGRPVDRLGGLMPKMRAAEASPVSQILSRFNDIHRDPDVRQTFEVFRHVVFDMGGVYYVAVPLDAPYRWTPRDPNQRFGYASADAEALQQEAHLLGNLFTSFEKERIFARVYSPLLTTGAIQRKLARQGSKFASCEAFRVYRFRDGAWPEIILGAVMGAAKRAEEARAAGTSRSDAGGDPLLNGQVRTASGLGDRDDASSAAHSRRNPREGRREIRREPALTEMSEDQSAPPGRFRARAVRRNQDLVAGAGPNTVIDPDLVAKHGPYARFAKADLRHAATADVDVRTAANSNTTPDHSILGSDPSGGSDTVIPLPLRSRPSHRTSASPSAGAAVAHMVALHLPDSVPPLELPTSQPETGRAAIPVSEATLPGTLFMSQPTASGRTVRLPDEAEILDAPFAAIARVLGGGGAVDPIDSLDAADQTADDDGVAIIAGRLRPAIPGE